MADPYAAAPLDLKSQELRLIQLQPSEETEMIRCSLRSYSLQNCPPYTALSYCWGSIRDCDDIEINGVRCPVRENLWFFLHQMRLQRDYNPLWIDAICINQSKVRERNHQVQIMGQIYSRARSVFIWLGKADDTSDIAMEKLRKRKPFEIGKSNFRKIWNVQQAQSILALCERSYWQRMWIIQEVMLAKEVVIGCGSMILSWQKLVQLIKNLQMIVDRGRDIHTPCAHAILTSPATTIVKAKSERDRSPRPLGMLLRTFGEHESTDFRDKVYALLGLAKNGSSVEINYDKSEKNVLLDVFHHERKRVGWGVKEKDDLIRFGQLLRNVLKVPFPETEIYFEMANPRTVDSGITNKRTAYHCLFGFLGCSYFFPAGDKWRRHCMEHFGGMEPPRWVRCSQCELPEQRFDDGWEAWNYKLYHATQHQGLLQSTSWKSCGGPPDFYLIEHLWQRRLIDDLDLEELTVGNHCLTMPPLTRTRASQVERCEKCSADLERPVLPCLDEYRYELWDKEGVDYDPTRSSVIKVLKKHRSDSEEIYKNWVSLHRHGSQGSFGRPSHLIYLSNLRQASQDNFGIPQAKYGRHEYPQYEVPGKHDIGSSGRYQRDDFV
ncbi:HET-domain-containing protein [Lentithecium fluviatile CBS 122367]|uniref:HET-domain-containing protein n=1 Tax=Lentithecium fluviatile CBS 122367 TaxID=1168545 RepID=A0A6G1J012_9PLEO|nr:HET-domain-containing protein [Lentithecium fluviatile CBS 122367]